MGLPSTEKKIWLTPGAFICLAILITIPLWMLLFNSKKTLPSYNKIEKWCYQNGDNIDWAKPEWNTNDWNSAETLSSIGVGTHGHKGSLWIRGTHNFTPSDELSQNRNLILNTAISSEFNLYWDGVQLEPIPMKDPIHPDQYPFVRKSFSIPSDLLSMGEHLIAIRIEEQQREQLPLILYLTLGNPRRAFIDGIRFQDTDDPTFSETHYDDRNWPLIHSRDPKTELPTAIDEICWLRFPCVFTQPGVRFPYQSLQLSLASFGAHEIYWDGELVGKTGKLSSSTSPGDPGSYLNIYTLAGEKLGIGQHQVAIRFSQQVKKGKSKYIVSLGLSPPMQLSYGISNQLFWYTVPFGIILMNALFFVLYFFFNEKRWAYLILSGFYFTGALYLFVVLSALLTDLPIEWMIYRVILKNILLFAAGALLVNFHIFLFSIPRRKTWIFGSFFFVLLAVAYKVFQIFNSGSEHAQLPITYGLYIAIPLVCLGICTYAVAKRKKGAWWALAGILFVSSTIIGLILSNARMVGNPSIYISFAVHTICLIISTLVEGRESRRIARATQSNLELTKTRLELELIKKNIQPHFIMNTLTSLTEWIERNPHQSVHFIEALADEFRLASELASETLIPMRREIEVCRSFLQLMNYQENLDFQLEVKVDSNDGRMNILIPPYILHTLVENGITHNDYSKSTHPIVFHLEIEKEEGQIRLIFRTPIGKKHNLKRKKNQKIPGVIQKLDGAGSKYIKARLNECYQDQWTLNDERRNGFWETTILIPIETDKMERKSES